MGRKQVKGQTSRQAHYQIKKDAHWADATRLLHRQRQTLSFHLPAVTCSSARTISVINTLW